MRLFAAAALTALLALSGCSAAEAPSAAPALTVPPSLITTPARVQPRPVRVQVPARQIDGPIMPDGLGLDASGGHAEPPVESPELASWYNLGPRPGALGPAVVLGHVNGDGKAGVFANLRSVRMNDFVIIHREDGTEISFEVYRLAKVEKTDFSSADVYGNTPGPELRLITCGGELDRVHHRYLSNVIVFARQVQVPG